MYRSLSNLCRETLSFILLALHPACSIMAMLRSENGRNDFTLAQKQSTASPPTAGSAQSISGKGAANCLADSLHLHLK